MRKSVEKVLPGENQPPSIGRPVLFEGDHTAATPLALDRLTEAAQYAGFQSSTFYPEPLAATLSYLHAHEDGQANTGALR